MVKIERVGAWLKMTINLKEMQCSDCLDCSEALQFICSHTNKKIEYIGNRVTKERQKITLIKYKDIIYDEMTWERSFQAYTFIFRLFPGKVEDTEPFENYQYYIEYCDPKIDDQLTLFYYFKKSELLEAKRMQDFLGKKLALLNEIEN